MSNVRIRIDQLSENQFRIIQKGQPVLVTKDELRDLAEKTALMLKMVERHEPEAASAMANGVLTVEWLLGEIERISTDNGFKDHGSGSAGFNVGEHLTWICPRGDQWTADGTPHKTLHAAMLFAKQQGEPIKPEKPVRHTQPRCRTCWKAKAPFGRDVPVECDGWYCTPECSGYNKEPLANDLWRQQNVDPHTRP